MKKIIALAFGLAIISTACKKEYNCSCSVGFGGQSYIKGTVKASTKSKATSSCKSKAASDEYCVAQ